MARPPHRPASTLVALLALGALVAVAGCVPADRRPTWRLFPLQRQQPHDGLAVVSQPDGYGLHIWLETDTRRKGVCRPRWLPDPARLFNGNGSHPFSSGLASREEFFAAVARRDVRRALRRELEALCLSRAPRSTWEWIEPPLNPSQVKVEKLPMLEEKDLLTDPETIRQQEQDPEQKNATKPEADAATP
ncbi:hypothetical protein I1E95_09390 [Synechococcus sp. CBW1107]|uniref:hypothetical protein n=1 Tax=unclassified Synechococcus TaxID=2626047 RepID=UPI0018CF8E3B|nr:MULTISPECIES: hypothetical protein [unclassified Synechococcus]QPN58255.1 hypothetical protein I1E95_09390 [Synechococcus sp. CBW1107]